MSSKVRPGTLVSVNRTFSAWRLVLNSLNMF
jgi:hypothetical protein